jgi:hypothetical protein
LRSAAQAKTEQQRQAFLDMARTWEEAALKMESGTLPSAKPAHSPDAR